jgi:predicted acyltransferase (DUF342 family)
MKPILTRNNTLEQWRQLLNRTSHNIGDPVNVYTADAPNAAEAGLTGAPFTNSTDSYTHDATVITEGTVAYNGEINAIVLALNDLSSRKLKRTGDTISGSLGITNRLHVEGDVNLGAGNASKVLTITGTAVNIPNNLNFDSNTLYIDAVNNRVGVGQVPSSTEAFQVTGSTKLTGALQVTSTSQYDGDVTIGSTRVTVAAATGNTVVNGTFTSNAAATFSSSVNVTGLDVNTVISPTGTGTVTISPVAALTVNPTAASTINNCSIGATTRSTGSFTTLSANGAVTINGASVNTVISPTGTGTVTISPAGALTVNPTAASTINNCSIGATTRSTGAFTTLTANAATTLTGNVTSTTTTSGTLIVTGGVGISENVYIGGNLVADNLTSRTTNGNLTLVGNGNGVVLVNDALRVSGTIVQSQTDTNLEIAGNGTGVVLVNDDLSVAGDVAITGGDLTTSAALFNLGNPATTGSFTTAIVPGAGTTGTRSINIGSAGDAGSTTTINIGPNTLGTSNVNIGSAGVAGSRTKLLWGAAAAQWSLTDTPGTGLKSSNGTVLFQIGADGVLDLRSASSVSDLTVLNDMQVNGFSYLGDAVGDLTVIGLNTAISTAQPAPSADTVANIPIASFASATYRSAEFLVQGVGSTSTNAVITKVYAVHNGAGSVFFTEYGRVVIGNTLVDEGGFSVDISGGNVRLLVNQALANTVWKITMTLTKA